jgi:hypothetical protein
MKKTEKRGLFSYRKKRNQFEYFRDYLFWQVFYIRNEVQFTFLNRYIILASDSTIENNLLHTFVSRKSNKDGAIIRPKVAFSKEDVNDWVARYGCSFFSINEELKKIPFCPIFSVLCAFFLCC